MAKGSNQLHPISRPLVSPAQNYESFWFREAGGPTVNPQVAIVKLLLPLVLIGYHPWNQLRVAD